MSEVVPDFQALIAQADVLRDAGNMHEAESLYRQILAVQPDHAIAHYKLGVLCARTERLKEAEFAYQEALRYAPAYPEAANNLGMLLFQRGRPDEAERQYRVALAERPDYYEASLNLGNLLAASNRTLEARFFYQRAIDLRPESAVAYQRLGELLQKGDKLREAITVLTQATRLDPDLATAWNTLGVCALNLSRADEAIGHFRRAVAAQPDYLVALKNIALSLNYMIADKLEVFAAHQEVSRVIHALHADKRLTEGFSQSLDPERRIRIGFVSGDLRTHSVSYFLLEVLRALNHHAFEFHAFYVSASEDARSQDFKVLFHHWHGVHYLREADLAATIRAQQIDILIDLAGNTGHNRLEVFCLNAAPLQMAWVGYPNTTALPEIGYRLTDRWADPEGQDDAFYSERLLRLPGGFLCYGPPSDAPPVAPPPVLSRGYITFGSFNQRTKLGAACIAAWSKVLQAVPDSRLVLKSVFGYAEGVLRNSVLEAFEAHGIARDRITLLAAQGTTVEHLGLYAEMDIALDTFPYNGTTTTCEALWMGVPVVALAGDRHVSRVGVSLLNCAGLAELIGRDETDFVRIAVALAHAPQQLVTWREGMRARLQASRLLDAAAMARDLEAVWRELWRDHCRTAPPPTLSSSYQAPDLLRLNIGGTEARAGWLILDIEARTEVDIVCSIEDLSRFDNASCAEIYCAHVLQCLPIASIIGVLQALHRILVPGGRLYLAVPDLDVLAGLMLESELSGAGKFNLMRQMFGMQQTEYDYYRTGLNFDLLQNCLSDVGFSALEHVESFGMFADSSELYVGTTLASLNLIVTK